LAQGRKGKAHASSQYALEHLEEIHEQWASVGDVDDAQLALESLSVSLPVVVPALTLVT